MVNDSRSIDRPDHITDDDAPASPAGGIGSHADEALRALYAEHRPALLAYAEGFTGDRGQAEDVVQEAFLCAWRHLPGLLEDEQPVRAWLLRVTHRLLIDAARAARARPFTESDPSAQPFVDGGLDQLLDQTMLVGANAALIPATPADRDSDLLPRNPDARHGGAARCARGHRSIPAARRPTATTGGRGQHRRLTTTLTPFHPLGKGELMPSRQPVPDAIPGEHPARAVGAIALAAVAIIHVLDLPSTLQATPLIGYGYFVLIGAALAGAAMLITVPWPRVWALVDLIAAVAILAYVLTAPLNSYR